MPKTLLIFILFLICNVSHANVIWLWNFETEYGYIVTNGSFADTMVPNSFDIISFHVSNSQFNANIGANYLESQPVQGFLWDGNVPVEFFRSSGAFTNGSNFYLENSSFFYGLNPTMAVFDAAVRAGAFPISGPFTLKTDIIFRNRFE